VADAPNRPDAGGSWRALQAIADDAEPGVRRAFLAALRGLRTSLDLRAIEEALLRKDTARVLELVPLADFAKALAAVEPKLAGVRDRALEAEATRLATDLGDVAPAAAATVRAALGTLGTNGIAEVTGRVRAAIEAQAAARVVDVTDETRRALRDTIQRAYDAGVHTRVMARRIRQEVGLTRRQAEAVSRYRTALAGAKLPPARVDQLVDRYANRLLSERAQTIASTETAQAVNDGQRAGWEDLRERGLVSGDVYEREWLAIIPGGGRTCPRCINLDGTRAPIGGVFTGDEKGPTKGPPLHPRCRCSEVLVRRAGHLTRPRTVDAGATSP